MNTGIETVNTIIDPVAFRVDSHALSKLIASKVQKYAGICQNSGSALVVAVVADPVTGLDTEDVESVLFGIVKHPIVFDKTTRQVLLEATISLPRWSLRALSRPQRCRMGSSERTEHLGIDSVHESRVQRLHARPDTEGAAINDDNSLTTRLLRSEGAHRGPSTCSLSQKSHLHAQDRPSLRRSSVAITVYITHLYGTMLTGRESDSCEYVELFRTRQRGGARWRLAADYV